MTTPRERYLTAGELSAQLREMGISPFGYDYCLALIRAARFSDGRPMSVGRVILLSDAIEWIRLNDFRPEGKNTEKRQGVPKCTKSPAIINL